jgi:hypothetical protein
MMTTLTSYGHDAASFHSRTLHVRSVGSLLTVYRTMQANPETIYSLGDSWDDIRWAFADLQTWLRRCLTAKINRNDARAWRKLSRDYAHDLEHDARVINDYTARRARNRGANILRTPEMKRQYPEIDNPTIED